MIRRYPYFFQTPMLWIFLRSWYPNWPATGFGLKTFKNGAGQLLVRSAEKGACDSKFQQFHNPKTHWTLQWRGGGPGPQNSYVWGGNRLVKEWKMISRHPKTETKKKLPDVIGGGKSNIFYFHPELRGRCPIWWVSKVCHTTDGWPFLFGSSSVFQIRI